MFVFYSGVRKQTNEWASVGSLTYWVHISSYDPLRQYSREYVPVHSFQWEIDILSMIAKNYAI